MSGLAAAVVGAESPESTRPEAESTRETSVDPLVPDWKGGLVAVGPRCTWWCRFRERWLLSGN